MCIYETIMSFWLMWVYDIIMSLLFLQSKGGRNMDGNRLLWISYRWWRNEYKIHDNEVDSIVKDSIGKSHSIRLQSMIERIVLQMIHNLVVLITGKFVDILIAIFNQEFNMRDFQVIYFLTQIYGIITRHYNFYIDI